MCGLFYFSAIKNRLSSWMEEDNGNILISFSAGDINVCVCVRERKRPSLSRPHQTEKHTHTMLSRKLVTSSLLLIVFLLDRLFVLWFNVLIIKTSRHSFNTQMYKLFYSVFFLVQLDSSVSVCVCAHIFYLDAFIGLPPRLCQYFDLKLWPWSVLMKSWSYTPSLQTCAGSFHDISNCLLCIFSAGFRETPL